jgi:hypothetical protein
MTTQPLHPISPAETRRRLKRVKALARRFGFVGRIEYRHVLAHTGGAQYGRGTSAEHDVLTVDARAFQRDADPEDFSLEAIIAHERGHQRLHREPALARLLKRWTGLPAEEMLASLVASLIVVRDKDRADLLHKAVGEALACGVEPEDAVWLASELRAHLERHL